MDWRPPGWKYLPKEGIEGWTEKVFFALIEVSVLALPALIAASAYGPNVLDQSFGAGVSLLVLVLGVGTAKSEYSPIEADWPGISPATLLAGVCWYNGTILAAAFLGATIDLLVLEALGTLVFAAGVSLVAVVTFPRFVTWVRRLLSWWTWGRPFP